MTLQAVWDILVGWKEEAGMGLIILVILMSIVQVSKININPWDWLLFYFINFFGN